MTGLLADAPVFWKGAVVIVCAFVLFVGSIYLLLAAVFGLRMGYLVLAVSFFGWMILLSLLWAVGQPKFPPPIGFLKRWSVTGTLPNLGPRGTEKHWQVYAAGTGQLASARFTVTSRYPDPPWHSPNKIEKASVSSVSSAMQKYLVQQALDPFSKNGQRVCPTLGPPQSNCVTLDPTTFVIQDMRFTRSNKTSVVGAHAFFTLGGPEITVFAYRDSGNLPVYSVAFLGASLILFLIHLPFLDRAERKRKAFLTGGTAPPWYGPA
jgi:hypothetical protein